MQKRIIHKENCLKGFPVLLRRSFWNSLSQVIEDRVHHIEYNPPYPEEYYMVTGREIQPNPVGEEAGTVVFQYYPMSAVNYVRMNKIKCLVQARVYRFTFMCFSTNVLNNTVGFELNLRMFGDYAWTFSNHAQRLTTVSTWSRSPGLPLIVYSLGHIFPTALPKDFYAKFSSILDNPSDSDRETNRPTDRGQTKRKIVELVSKHSRLTSTETDRPWEHRFTSSPALELYPRSFKKIM